ncbi:MAG: class I SAM-dependent methyltransferase [Planctomycetaceae bacterium]|nr:class I SAM-dependent methyltransferase [Planctomycetaceae bacterium]
MNRIQVLQSLLDRQIAPAYLEIGVETGYVLLALKAGRKFAVDPAFKIPWYRKLRAHFDHRSNRHIEYFEMPSDEFFLKHSDRLSDGLDVVFVDGLHTHEQAYRDVVNALPYLKPHGVIVMHDCLPPHAAAALRADSPQAAEAQGHPGWTGEWTGDVYKTVMQLRACHDDLEVFTLDCDYGLGVVARGASTQRLEMSLDEIQQLTYEQFLTRRSDYLNLKEPDFWARWLADR